MNKYLVACFGDEESSARIATLASSAEVIAVAFDFGGAVSLGAMREMAIAAGAARCHALDVREEFARDKLMPALRQRMFTSSTRAFPALARAFAIEKLHELAPLERAAVVVPDAARVPSRSLRRLASTPLQLEITFDEGVPVSINGVAMPLAELMESVETITGEPALCVLDREMARWRELQTA